MKRSPLHGALAGALAGAAGALAMNMFQRLAAQTGQGREADDATIGLPRTGRGPQPAQALGNASDDATARVANAALSVVGYELSDPRAKQMAGEFVHLAFGALNGAAYGLAAELDSRVTAAAGVPFGAAVWAVADEGIVPALGLSRGPREASAGLLAYGLLSHFVYGLTTEAVRSALRSQPLPAFAASANDAESSSDVNW
jgi:putative membrane protein